ncbi:DUF418 domain-containing protein [Streptomyces luteolus]|uniref:DUF418 domain-containing protein n=1 Tax=Streptomyces luteolus TaxID=3043615 RepID=A0ABT6T454_9ACTN|nr:DUF418 domain-containing protein [Streptomyces sp. B-S-A12]MDI3422168.1 DUF418 domain-containing protein [Streptomyces sp. B-S-A12]
MPHVEPDTTSPSAAASPRTPPPARAGRLPLLDVLRGVAIIGTLMTNVWIFTGPGAEVGFLNGAAGASLHTLLDDPTPGNTAESVFRFLADGKFLSLLTVLFGVGLAIQYDSALRKGLKWPGRYDRRALFLFGEGLLHFILIFAWDVLMGYAVTAYLVARLLNRSDRFRRRVMWTAAGLHLTVIGLLTFVLATAPEADGSGADDAIALYADGSYLDQVLFRLRNMAALRIEPVLSFGLLVCLFLLGVRLHRAGAFAQNTTGRALRTRMAVWGLTIGLPLNAAVSLAGPDWFLIGRYVAAPAVAIGYIGLIGALFDRVRHPGPLTHGLTALGRCALSGYVLQNLLCVLLAYGFGLGLASRLADTGPWWVMGLWAAVSLTLMAGAALWLRRFRQGPLETLQKRALSR